MTEPDPSVRLIYLLERIAQEQCQDAFSELFQSVAPRLKAYAMKLGSPPMEAEEIAQDSMLTVWRKAAQFNPRLASPHTWLFTIARNRRIDFYRKQREELLDSDDLWPDPESGELDVAVSSDLDAQLLRTLIDALPADQRQVLFKMYFEDKSHSEIAEEMDIPLGTVKSRLRLAMAKLENLAQEQFVWLLIILTTIH
ncbi:MAG: sigma-70 family RNA polymerase sigma factor [Hahellaceae bacterium]|nr:sigma-70 family RNA polymerase sigma factor [Hahellaceae bacterium]MCP5168612.1 sigma-70 family RNA polymerase sigma factor [Hahellaceae bacterium]